MWEYAICLYRKKEYPLALVIFIYPLTVCVTHVTLFLKSVLKNVAFACMRYKKRR